jgi:hypothetical protein
VEKTIDIMFSDLTEEKQKEIAESLNYLSVEECIQEHNWDVIPFTEVTLGAE